MTTRYTHVSTAPIGRQLLVHYAQRDQIRHTTPLIPFSWQELAARLRALVGHSPKHCST